MREAKGEVLATPKNTLSKNATLIATTIAAFLPPFMASALNVALPAMGTQFSMNAVSLGWINSSYLLASAVFLVPFGRIADIMGRKKIFILGTAIFTLASLLLAFASSSTTLISFRLLQGLGVSMLFGTGVAILTSVFPIKERGRALGINAAAVFAGLSAGPSIGGVLTENFGWRSVFVASVPLGLVVICLTLWKMRAEWAEAKGEKFDIPGSLIYGVSLTLLMYGLSKLPALWAGGLILGGAVGIWAFIAWELKAANPVFDVKLFRNNSVFTFSNLAQFISHGATFAVTFLLSLYLQETKGLNAEQAGLILLWQPLLMAAISPLSGRLSDKTEPRIVSSIGMATNFVGLVLCIFLKADTSLVFIILCLVILGAGSALFAAPNSNAIMGSVDRKFYGAAAAANGTSRLVGNTVSMGIIMLMFALYMGSAQIASENAVLFLQSQRVAFIIYAVLCFGGIFASLVRGNLRAK